MTLSCFFNQVSILFLIFIGPIIVIDIVIVIKFRILIVIENAIDLIITISFIVVFVINFIIIPITTILNTNNTEIFIIKFTVAYFTLMSQSMMTWRIPNIWYHIWSTHYLYRAQLLLNPGAWSFHTIIKILFTCCFKNSINTSSIYYLVSPSSQIIHIISPRR